MEKNKLPLLLFFVILILPHVAACEKEVLVANNQNSIDSIQMEPFIVFSEWNNMQGGAIYNDKLVCLMACDEIIPGHINGFIYDLKTGVKECDLYFPTKLCGREFTRPHANQVSFGSSFYNSLSDFPLLYVSQVNGGTGDNNLQGERGVLVYDLARNVEGGYTPELVQAIIPDLKDNRLLQKLGRYTPNYIVDKDNNQFVIIGYPQNSWYRLEGSQPIAIINIPSLEEGEIVVFNNDAVKDSFSLPKTVGIQQSFIYKNKVYSAGGLPAMGSIRIIDMKTKLLNRFFELHQLSSGEPQFLGKWHEHILYYEAGTEGVMYELIFKPKIL